MMNGATMGTAPTTNLLLFQDPRSDLRCRLPAAVSQTHHPLARQGAHPLIEAMIGATFLLVAASRLRTQVPSMLLFQNLSTTKDRSSASIRNNIPRFMSTPKVPDHTHPQDFVQAPEGNTPTMCHSPHLAPTKDHILATVLVQVVSASHNGK